jgi:hypothetical protein
MMTKGRGIPIIFWSALLSIWVGGRYWIYPVAYNRAVIGGKAMAKAFSSGQKMQQVSARPIRVKPRAMRLILETRIVQSDTEKFSKPFTYPATRITEKSSFVLHPVAITNTPQSVPDAVIPPFANTFAQNAPYAHPNQKRLADQKRLEVYGYSFMRPGTGQPSGLSAAPQYGGGQSGVIAAYRVMPQNWPSVSIIGHASRSHNGSRPWELAAGIRTVPIRSVPISVSAERRFRAGGDVTAIYAAGSKEDIALPADFSARGYAQLGVVLGKGSDHFYDANIRIDRPVLNIGETRMHLGIGSWTGGQRGADRIDIGPTMRTQIKAGKIPVTITADWRFRAAGNAVPGDGPAITVSAGF